jgi:hypothetical protein
LLVLSLSLKAFTFTGATVDDTVALVIGAIVGLIEDDDLDVAGVETEGALEDFCDCDWVSEGPVKDEAVGDCIREDGLESCSGDVDVPLDSLVIARVEVREVAVLVF